MNKNLYGLKQAAHNWFECLKQGLLDHGFEQYQIDPCKFYHGSTIILVYVDDCIIFDKSKTPIDKFIESLKISHENYTLTDEMDTKDYLGVELICHSKDFYELHQPFLINRILKF